MSRGKIKSVEGKQIRSGQKESKGKPSQRKENSVEGKKSVEGDEPKKNVD